jgi:prephenate dehydrogenase
VYVSSTGSAGDDAAREVMNFWEEVLGSHPVLVDALSHDTQLAWTSHLPQAVASALGHALFSEASLRGASWGTGARDTTRLAASPPDMWVDIFLMNRDPVRTALERAEGELAALRGLIEGGDRAGLLAYLEEAAVFRRRLDETGGLAGPSRRRATEPDEG